jgi:hypothetical protein
LHPEEGRITLCENSVITKHCTKAVGSCDTKIRNFSFGIMTLAARFTAENQQNGQNECYYNSPH